MAAYPAQSGKCIHEAGLKHEVCVSMMSLAPGWDTTGKIHNEIFYEKVLRSILDSGVPFDSVCFKDASGTIFAAVSKISSRFIF